MTDINLFTGCVVCNGFSKLKSMTYVIYVYVLFSYIQHGREVVVNINIDFRFYVCFQTKPKSFVSYIQSVGDPKSLDFKFYSAIHRQCLKLGRLLNLSLLKMKNGWFLLQGDGITEQKTFRWYSQLMYASYVCTHSFT